MAAEGSNTSPIAILSHSHSLSHKHCVASCRLRALSHTLALDPHMNGFCVQHFLIPKLLFVSLSPSVCEWFVAVCDVYV